MATTDPTRSVAVPPGKSLVVRARDRVVDLGRRVQSRGLALLGESRSSVMEDAIPFQDDIEEILEERAPPLLRSMNYLVAGLFISFVVIATVVKVDVVVVGTGRLVTDSPTILLQPMDRSIIREINVKAGDVVTKGQVLATLDPTFAQADVASLAAQQRAVEAQVRRLEAELNGSAFEAGSGSNSDDVLQTILFRQRQSEYQSRLRVFDQDVLRIEAGIRTADDDRGLLAQQLEVARDVESMRASAVKSQAGSRLQFLDSQAARMQAERDFRETSNRLAELQHEMASRQAGRAAFIDEWRRQLLESLVSTRTEAAKLTEAMTKAARMRDLVMVTAPQDGVVLEVAKRSVGSVMREAEALATIVPANATLIAEINISSTDVGYTRTGDEALIKVDAFPYQRHGTLPGRLLTVSEESFSAGGGVGPEGGLSTPGHSGGGAFHRSRVALERTTLEAMPQGGRLIPGMTLSAEIKVGTRTIMSYFLDPVTRSLGDSIREP